MNLYRKCCLTFLKIHMKHWTIDMPKTEETCFLNNSNTCTLFQSESNISFSCRDCSASLWHWRFSGLSSWGTSCVDCSKFCKDSSLSPCLSPEFRWTGSRDLLSFPSWKAFTKAALLCMSVWSSLAILAKYWSHNKTQPKSSSEIKDRYRYIKSSEIRDRYR